MGSVWGSLLKAILNAQSVPDLEEEVVARLRELEGELKPLAEQQQKIEDRAYRWGRPASFRALSFFCQRGGPSVVRALQANLSSNTVRTLLLIRKSGIAELQA